MTVSEGSPIAGSLYTGPGVNHPFTFPVFVEDNVEVQYVSTTGAATLWRIGVEYTVTLNADPSGGGFITGQDQDTGASLDGSIEIYRSLPISQDEQWNNTGPFRDDLLEGSLDKNIMILQEMELRLNGSLSTVNWVGDWVTGYDYKKGQIVTAPDGSWYSCLVDHTSTTFSADLASGLWMVALNTQDIEDDRVAAAASAALAEQYAVGTPTEPTGQSAKLNREQAQAARDEAVPAAQQAVISEANAANSAQESANCAQAAHDSAAIVDPALLVYQTGPDGAAIFPKGTTGQRPVSPVIGYQRFNTDLGLFEGWDGLLWQPISGSEPVGSSDSLITGLIPTNWREVIRTGWTPAWFNQQWGGAPYGDAFNEAATGYAPFDQEENAGAALAGEKRAIQFVISKNTSITSVILPLSKTGNPLGDVLIEIASNDGSDNPGSVLGTANLVSCKTLSGVPTETEFTFSTPVSVSAGTKYHIIFSSDAPLDANNFPNYVVDSQVLSYPLGGRRTYNGSTWTQGGYNASFKIITSTSTADGKLNCYEGTPLNQSGAVTRPIKECFIGDTICYAFKAENITNDKPLLDMVYGLEQDRILLGVESGLLVLTVYEGSGDIHVYSGTTTVTSGQHTIGIVVEDGKQEIWVDGVLDGTAGTSAISFSEDFKNKGTVIVGGGMPIGVTWTKETDMSVLPSADGWTYSGEPIEANVFSVSDGKLHMNKNGFGSTDQGNYTISPAFNNATGWIVECKLASQAGVDSRCVEVYIYDGTYRLLLTFDKGAILQSSDVRAQFDCSKENVFSIFGKGTDYYLFANGKLLIDGTGLHTFTTADYRVVIGDNNNSSGINADAVYDYINYKAGWEQPEYTSASIWDLAFWSKDVSSEFLNIHVNGLQKAIGMKALPTVERVESRVGIEISPTTTSTSPSPLPDLQLFSLCEKVSLLATSSFTKDSGAAASNKMFLGSSIDGLNTDGAGSSLDNEAYWKNVSTSRNELLSFGMHFISAIWCTSGTGQLVCSERNLIVRSK